MSANQPQPPHSQEEVVRIISSVTAKAQADESFRQQYIENPNHVLTQHGLQIPSGVDFHVIEGLPSDMPDSTPTDIYLIVPQVEEVVQDESLATAAAASCQSTASTCFTVPSCVSCASSASTQSCS